MTLQLIEIVSNVIRLPSFLQTNFSIFRILIFVLEGLLVSVYSNTVALDSSSNYVILKVANTFVTSFQHKIDYDANCFEWPNRI